MSKLKPYILSGVMAALWLALQFRDASQANLGETSEMIVFGFVGIIAILLFSVAWKIGKNPEKPFIFVVLISIVALLTPVLTEYILEQEIEIETTLVLLLYLSPIIPACIIGHFTRRRSWPVAVRTFVNALPGMLLLAWFVFNLFYNTDPWYRLNGVSEVVFVAVVVLLSAYCETCDDKTERRELHWNCWRLFLILEILIGFKNSGTWDCGDLDWYAYYTFNLLFAVMLPVVLQQCKEWLEKNQKNRIIRAAGYFLSAIVLTVFQAGSLYYLMNHVGHHFELSSEWIIIDVIAAFIVYLQRAELASDPETKKSADNVEGNAAKHKWIKVMTAVLLSVSVLAEIGYGLVLTTDIEETVLDSYKVNAEDAAEWDAVAAQIVQIITEEKPYYLAENRKELSEDEAQKWQEESRSFMESFLSSDMQHASAARDIAGGYYIKCTVIHTLMGDDTGFDAAYYIPYAKLKKCMCTFWTVFVQSGISTAMRYGS